jgi:osmotically-inducible protein OsmY
MAFETSTPTSLAGFDDIDLQHRVQLYLESRQTPEFRDLTVEVDNGVVRVCGTLDNVNEREKALNICRRVAGVIQLVDEIRIAEARKEAASRFNPR